jgi:hypothetical protein
MSWNLEVDCFVSFCESLLQLKFCCNFLSDQKFSEKLFLLNARLIKLKIHLLSIWLGAIIENSYQMTINSKQNAPKINFNHYTSLNFKIFCKMQRPEYTFLGDWRMLIPKIITILLEHLWFPRKLTV